LLLEIAHIRKIYERTAVHQVPDNIIAVDALAAALVVLKGKLVKFA
jgi:hypothetical protein